MKKAFSMLDSDHSGFITIDELRGVFEVTNKKSNALWTGIMEEVDLNRDGLISYDEFSTSMYKVINQQFFGLETITSKVQQRMAEKFKQQYAVS